jgi:hypothetical protein
MDAARLAGKRDEAVREFMPAEGAGEETAEHAAVLERELGRLRQPQLDAEACNRKGQGFRNSSHISSSLAGLAKG